MFDSAKGITILGVMEDNSPQDFLELLKQILRKSCKNISHVLVTVHNAQTVCTHNNCPHIKG